MIVSTRLVRGFAAFAVLSSLAACGGGGGGSPPGSPPNLPTTRSIGGTVTGLNGTGLVLRNNGGDNLAVSASGTFTFATAIAEGGAYAVTVFTQPDNPAQNCVVDNGSGTVASSNVTNVTVTCSTDTFAIGATVSGLTGGALRLSNGQDQLTVNANGFFTFDTPVSSGSRYNVIVDAAPSDPVQRCNVTGGMGMVASANVNVVVECVATFPTFAYTINQGDNTFSSQAINAATGQLRARFSAKTGARPRAPVTYKPGNGKQFSYIANQNSDNISAFALDPRSGAIDEVAGSPFATGGDEPTVLTLHPTRPFLYAPNANGTTIAAFTIDANTGVLTSAGTAATGTKPQTFQIDATGRFAYAATPDSAELYTYAIDQTTGALTEVAGSRVTIGTSIGGMTLERNGRYLYLFNPTPGTISAYAINAATGALTALAGSPFTAGLNAAFAALHPNGKFIYVRYSVPAQTSASGLGVFAIDAASGALSQVAGSPFDVTANPMALAFDPTGGYLYASHVRVDNVPEYEMRGYHVNGSTGALSPVAGSPFSSSLYPYPFALDVDGSGQYLYVTSLNSNQLTSYRIDSGDGSLSLLSGAPTNVGSTPTFVTVEEDTTPLQLKSKFVYSTDAVGDFIHIFSLDDDGMLAQSTAPVIAGADPHGVTLDPQGRYAYVANTASDSVSIYTVEPTTGALSEVAGSPVAAGAAPSYIAIGPNGRYAYVAAANSTSVLQFTIDQATGSLSSPVPTNLGQAVNVLKIAPNGNWLLVSSSDPSLRVYSINPATGALGATPVSNVNTGGAVSSIAVDPSGKLAYVTVAATGTLLAYGINSTDGTLSPQGTFSNFPNSGQPDGVAFDPLGNLAFTADGANGNTVSVFRVNSNGSFSYRSSVVAGTNPIAVATDYSGKFACVVTAAGEVLSFAINRDTQTLTQIDVESVTGISTSGGLTLSTHAE